MQFRHALAASLLAAISLGAAAAPTPPAIRAEIDGLMARMSASSCQFERNGSWYSAADARKHLLRKLDYIEGRRETLASAEQFIDVAASKSSFSGRPYRVRCGSADAMPSRDWLLRELKALRSAERR
jgi:hypothetical protein